MPQARVLDKVEDGTRNARRRFLSIRAREVSIVDEAANGREFLVVKQAGKTEDPMTVKDKDKKLMQDNGAGKTTELTVVKAADLVKEIDVHVAKAVEQSKTIEVLKQVHPDQFAMFAAMAEAIDFCNGTMGLVREDLVKFVSSGGKTGFMGEEVIKAATVEEKITAARDDMVAAVCKAVGAALGADVAATKAGRKMASTRLSKLKDAVKALSDLVSELDPEVEAKKEAPPMTKPADTDPNGNPPANAAGGATGLTAAQVEEIVTKAVGAATKPLADKLEETTKSLGAATDRLTKLESAPAKPASESANETEEVDAKKGAGKKSLFAGVV